MQVYEPNDTGKHHNVGVPETMLLGFCFLEGW